MSYSEELFSKSIKLVTKERFIKNYRPAWLINPSTGKRLEYDFYFPDLKIAFEIQGQHHYDDEKQKQRDLEKKLYRINLGSNYSW